MSCTRTVPDYYCLLTYLVTLEGAKGGGESRGEGGEGERGESGGEGEWERGRRG